MDKLHVNGTTENRRGIQDMLGLESYSLPLAKNNQQCSLKLQKNRYLAISENRRLGLNTPEQSTNPVSLSAVSWQKVLASTTSTFSSSVSLSKNTEKSTGWEKSVSAQ